MCEEVDVWDEDMRDALPVRWLCKGLWRRGGLRDCRARRERLDLRVGDSWGGIEEG